jgi:lambda repressor-like predicted transcriptional regulator
MKRSGTPTFVLTLPLVVKPGEDRNLMGRMEAGRRLTNATLGEALRRHGLLKQSKAWQHARTIADKKLRGATFQRLSKEAGFTPAALITFARTCKNEAGWKDRLGANVVQRIAEHVFAAVQQYALGQRGRPRFKGINRPLHSLEATTHAANIIWKKETGCVVLGDLTLPVLLPSAAQDPYLHQALMGRTKYCRVLWRNVNGKRRWWVQLMQEGVAPVKREQACGEIVGLDIGPSTIAVVGDNSASLVKFCYGKSVKVRAPGMLVEQLRRKAESAGGKMIDLHTWSLKMSQYDHPTQTCTKKPLSQRWHVLGDGSGVVQRDIYSAFLARCVMSNEHHPSHIASMWAAQKPVLLQTGWLREEPAKIEPSGKITVRAPSERVVCNRGLAIGHGQDAVVARQALGDPDGFALRTPRL